MCGKHSRMNDVGEMEERLVCSLRYAGNWPPSMQWKQISNTDRASAELTEGTTITLGNYSIESTFTIRDGQHTNVAKYVCITTFDKSHRPDTSTTATNIPNYSHTWEHHVTGRRQLKLCIIRELFTYLFELVHMP